VSVDTIKYSTTSGGLVQAMRHVPVQQSASGEFFASTHPAPASCKVMEQRCTSFSCFVQVSCQEKGKRGGLPAPWTRIAWRTWARLSKFSHYYVHFPNNSTILCLHSNCRDRSSTGYCAYVKELGNMLSRHVERRPRASCTRSRTGVANCPSAVGWTEQSTLKCDCCARDL